MELRCRALTGWIPSEWRAGGTNKAVVIVVNRIARKNGSPSRQQSSLRASACESTSGVVESSRGRQELVAAAPVVEPVALAELALAAESLDRAFHLAFCAAINSR
jgi:hypothetical protein